MSGSQTTQVQHIESLVLAFSHSRAKTLVGTDALRTVIAGQYRDIFRDERFELESLYTLLESQPGFNVDDVTPPLCRFKTWEADLGIEVILPPQLGQMSSLDIRATADECPVPSKELDRILERGTFTKEEREARAAKWSEEPTVSESGSSGPATRRPLLLGALTLVALAGFVVAGYFVYDSLFKSMPTPTVSPALFTGIPVKKAVRAGFDVKVLELTDEGWFAKPAKERRAAMRSTMTELGRDGIRGLFIRDKTGKIRASAQTFGPEQSRIRVRFY